MSANILVHNLQNKRQRKYDKTKHCYTKIKNDKTKQRMLKKKQITKLVQYKLLQKDSQTTKCRMHLIQKN